MLHDIISTISAISPLTMLAGPALLKKIAKDRERMVREIVQSELATIRQDIDSIKQRINGTGTHFN